MAEQSSENSENSDRSVSEVLGECRSTLYDSDKQNPENGKFLSTLIDLMVRVDLRLTAIEKNTSTLEQVNQKLDVITVRVDTTERAVADVEKRIGDLEKDMEGHSNLYDGVREEAKKTYKDVTDIRREIRRAEQSDSKMQKEIDELRKMCTELKDRVVDQQCRAMKYNLIFYGITEADEGTSEDSESVLKRFIGRYLNIEEDIPMANVHRIGRRDDRRRDGKPRPIIAKFVHYKDLMNVKRSAKRLKNTNYGISEQYPSEIEDVRRKLFAIARAERSLRCQRQTLCR